MRIDVILNTSYPHDRLAALGRLAEEQGLGGVWIQNDIETRDPFMNFVPLALASERIRMGPIAVSPFELHPLKMAGALLTLNEMSGGRAQMVVGGGGGTLQVMGIKATRMVRAVRECLEILQAAAQGETMSYAGEVFRVDWFASRWLEHSPPRIYAGANGPQMLRMAARTAEAIMVSDFTPDRIRWAHEHIDPVLEEKGSDTSSFPLNNFWAWHVKPTREEAHRESRIYLAVRGTIYPDYIRDVVDEDEAKIVTANLKAFMTAYHQKTPEIAGVPDGILEKICDRGTSATALADIDREIERLQTFRDAGLTEIALKIYSDPEDAIRIIGERVIPAL